ncbi:putative carboxylesterase 15 [Iris pallida]|uniref:Carboxylesterase 15 n=1 Tax=Iris pallida TaxID=29817 RepID=A0AAX6IFP1_IRIPA|nr:putative carboxylesterase 15 [Iris pallida]
MSSTIVVAEVPGFLQVFSDGSVKRFPLPTIAASPDHPSDGFKSKDVVIDAGKSVTARIFLPDTTSTRPLPVLVYYHGGGFCIGSTAWSGFHGFLGSLCAKAQVLIVSVDYRLAPEHRIPAAYDDGYLSLQWLARNGAVEPWLEGADLSRVFLFGESAGGNIVHNVMLRVAREPVEGLEIKGLMVIHPFFGSEGRVGSELGGGEAEKWVRMGDLLWQLSLPEGADRDHPACNFEKMPPAATQQFPAVMVFVAGLDTLKDRGVMYAEFLRGKGGLAQEVELVIAEGENHGFHVYNAATDSQADSQATRLLITQMTDFINQH